MARAFLAGVTYFAIAFGAGFVLGAVRVTAIAPRVGDTLAVLIELPIVLFASWMACGWTIRRFNVSPDLTARLLMGGAAFTLLIGAELTLGLTAFDRTIAEQMDAWTTPGGVLGLAGQALFALFPLMQRRGG